MKGSRTKRSLAPQSFITSISVATARDREADRVADDEEHAEEHEDREAERDATPCGEEPAQLIEPAAVGLHVLDDREARDAIGDGLRADLGRATGELDLERGGERVRGQRLEARAELRIRDELLARLRGRHVRDGLHARDRRERGAQLLDVALSRAVAQEDRDATGSLPGVREGVEVREAEQRDAETQKGDREARDGHDMQACLFAHAARSAAEGGCEIHLVVLSKRDQPRSGAKSGEPEKAGGSSVRSRAACA
jgi:hypothetical protein